MKTGERVSWFVGVVIFAIIAISFGLSWSDEAKVSAVLQEQKEAVVFQLDAVKDQLKDQKAEIASAWSERDDCKLKANLYQYAVEGLAQGTLSMVKGGGIPDLELYAVAKQQADAIIC